MHGYTNKKNVYNNHIKAYKYQINEWNSVLTESLQSTKKTHTIEALDLVECEGRKIVVSCVYSCTLSNLSSDSEFIIIRKMYIRLKK